MSKYYVVKKEDTLWKIARDHKIRYWPNILFAAGNNTLTNPDRIHPGDRIFIPSPSSIAPMEKHPVVMHKNVPLFTQAYNLCWKATGKMLYCRRNPTETAEADFERLVGEEFRTMTKGLLPSRWHEFYCTKLGMRQSTIASQNDLHYIIASYGPAIVAIGKGPQKHSVVMAGYDLNNGRWFIIDPAGREQIDFLEGDEIIVGKSSSKHEPTDQEKESKISYKTGKATIANMGRWLWILDTEIASSVFYY
jgi:LysM domain/Papain-like cysteine protease AvrRpt2